MTTDRWEQIKRLFHEALEYEPAQRPSFLKRACADDEPLGVEVESLLASHAQASGFIETPASDVAAALLAEDQAELVAGQMLHNFKVLSVLATGGMGQVYLADDTRLGRKVALKLLPPQFTVNSDRVRRFEQEARAASALNHPNIVTIHEIGQTDSLHFIATEFVDGKTLREYIANTRMTVGEVLEFAIQVASALQAAHEAGIVHRDIKPENIMVRRDGFVKVLDFGLAKLAPQETPAGNAEKLNRFRVKTNPGVVMGTVAYMSPEQARGEEVDERTDIWSLGIILYEIVAGRVPFDGETPSHVIVSILENELPPLLGAEVPAELKRIVPKALGKDRAERYQRAGDLAIELKNLKDELTVESRLKQFSKSVTNGDESEKTTDFGPTQIIRDSPTSTVHGLTRHTLSAEYFVRKIKRHKLYAVAALFIMIAGGMALTSSVIKRSRTSLSVTGKSSIAVLPLKPIDAAVRDDIYQIGIADALVSRLRTMKRLVVRDLSTTAEYSNSNLDPIVVGKEQQVDYVLEANYQLIGGKVRIIASLFNVATGVIEKTYQIDKDPNLVLASRDQIAAEVESNLLTHFATDSNRLTAKKGTSNEEAYRFYVHGKNLTNKRSVKDALEAVKNFEQAIKLDPNFARAYAAMAYAYRSSTTLSGSLPPRDQFEKAKEAVTKALELDNSLADAYSARGDLKHKYERDWAGAEKDFLTALELEPNNDLAHGDYAGLLGEWGRFDEAMAEIEAALAIDPRSLVYQRDRGRILYFARRYDEAIVQLKRVVELDENFGTAYVWLWSAYEMKGDYVRAFETIIKHQTHTNPDRVEVYQKAYETAGRLGVKRKYLELSKLEGRSSYNIAKQCAVLGETEQAFDYLNRAIERREGPAGMLKVEPVFDVLRGDPRFDELIRRIGL